MSPGSRPAVHLTAPAGWLNDPLGVSHRDGRYHVYYQSVPGSLEWNPGCHWSHASSADLVTWDHHPVALAPGEGDRGCWSGDLTVAPDGSGLILYSSIDEGDMDISRVRTARGDSPAADRWTKGPVVVEPPRTGLRMFRDPKVHRSGDGYRLLMGAGYDDGTAAVLSWTSPDLASWTYRGPLLERRPGPGDEPPTGDAWECPQLLRIDGRHVLVVSVWTPDELLDVVAAVGDLDGDRFHPESWTRLTWNRGHYAATAFLDVDGAASLLFWIRGTGSVEDGWAGAISVPYRLTLRDGLPALDVHPAALAGVRGRALGLDWLGWHRPAEALRIPAVDGPAACTLTRNGELLDVETSDQRVSLPVPRSGDPVRLLLDGGILEVCTGRGVVGLPLASPAADLPESAEVVPW